MIRNYLAIALRNIRKQPLNATIHILSLSIGIAACTAIYLFITDETSFDKFHSKSERIFRLNSTQNFTGTNIQKVAISGTPMGPALLSEFPEIANFTRFWGGTRRVLRIGDKSIMVEKVATVDSSFFSVLDFKMLHGDPGTALVEPNTMVFTEKTARKFFDDPGDAIGSIVAKRGREFKVTGVMQDPPENSHLQFDVLESMQTFIHEEPNFNTEWRGNFLNTYLLLKPGTHPSTLESKFADWLIRWTGRSDAGNHYTLYLQPMTEVHLQSTDVEHDYQNHRKFNGAYLDVFMVIGIFILVVAAVNFMNLTTARAAYRWKEIGVRSALGARKRQLLLQFLSESMLLSLIAFVIALLLDAFFIPGLNELIGRQLSLFTLLDNPLHALQFVSLALLLGVLVGLYPAFQFTTVNPVRVLKGNVTAGRKSVLRSSLVIVQFGLAIAMMVSTWVVLQQLFFMKDGDAGFDREQILLVELESRNIKMMHIKPNAAFEAMKPELVGLSSVKGVTASGQRLGNNLHQWGFKVHVDTGVAQFAPSSINVDPDYLTVYGIKLIEGRDFSPANTLYWDSFIVNEEMVKFLNLKDPVGRRAGTAWMHNDSLGTIIGVVKNFHFNSLHHKINTLSIVADKNWDYEEMSIKISGGNVNETIEEVRKIYERHVNNFPFSYTFLDQHFDNVYRSDQQMSSVVSIMAALAILISCMGLFGLVAITTERMIKEIGIRKVLGATEIQITALLLNNFTRLVIIAFALSAPVAYYFLDQWLQTFAYRIAIHLHHFILSGLAALLIAVVTISHHTIRSARANPVKALKCE